MSVAQAQEVTEEDESLKRYKESLGITAAATNFVHDANVPGRLVMTKVFLQCVDPETQAETIKKAVDLALDEKTLAFTVERGQNYRVACSFIVQRDMIGQCTCTIKYKKKGIVVLTENFLLGSYVPKPENPETEWMSAEIFEIPDAWLAEGSATAQLKICTGTSEPDSELFTTKFKIKIVKKGKDRELQDFLGEGEN